jgi:hypothetical protein
MSSVISSDYGHGQQTVGAPSRRERDHAAEARADRWPHREMLSELGWSDADLARASGYNFPKPIGRITKVLGWGQPGDLEPFWSKHQIAQWRADLHAFVKAVR